MRTKKIVYKTRCNYSLYLILLLRIIFPGLIAIFYQITFQEKEINCNVKVRTISNIQLKNDKR